MTNSGNELWLIIHGHFYQPPREDPWIGEIERQDSAVPYHDWNERINAECYAANTHSRTLNLQGRIVDIINNYAFISFNFGATLLSWLERHDVRTYRKILEADEVSRALNGGHGNALAQVYNHMIIPLANRRDKYTQVLWGLADFRRRFGREAEGIWLAETAVNMSTLEVLVEAGVRFIILSPTQAEAVRPSDQDRFYDVSNNSIDTSEAYFVNTKKGRIAVFFYDLEISKSVGFEHLLTNADNFWNRMVSANRPHKPVHMINIATDGESYGHHEPFANMCLAKLIHENRTRGTFKLSNYGHFLERFPPQKEVRLKEGNNQLGTAWSCSHGVGRWMEDCGCAVGGGPGWNQRWRTPLRAALDFLRDWIAASARRVSSGLVRDFWAMRNDYIELVLDSDEKGHDAFLERHAIRPLEPAEKGRILTLLEAQKYAMFMYTSCGWFFSEISGPEAVQCLRYASRALQLMEEFLPEDTKERFLRWLEQAPSNIPRFAHGRRVWEELVEPYLYDGDRAVNEAVLEYFLLEEELERENGTFRVNLTNVKSIERPGGTVFSSDIVLTMRATGQSEHYIAYIIRRSHLNIVSYVKRCNDPEVKRYLDGLVAAHDAPALIKSMSDWFPRAHSLKDLRRDSREKLLSALFKDAFIEMHALRSERIDEFLDLVDYYARLGVKIPAVERANLESTLNNEILLQIQRLEEDQFDFERITRLIDVARRAGLDINSSLLATLFSAKIREKLRRFLALRDDANFAELIELIAFTNKAELTYRRTEVEDSVFDILHGEIARTLEVEDPELSREQALFIERVLRLGAELNIHVAHFQNVFDQIVEVQGDNCLPLDREAVDRPLAV